jgi:hypothetical protein
MDGRAADRSVNYAPVACADWNPAEYAIMICPFDANLKRYGTKQVLEEALLCPWKIS